ncbi:MAG TPA: trypsin-like peptidase domain-containing protein [Rhodopila sp.]|uniref:trypsin-like peptidase domain-containing protein n=1 Tax=Rhodopila sp. TaxID=2480087 RepID=UPI002CA868E6|nr:trypsin-like peptidase domain-containing protein [Rhodopila sp.]HVY17298.1 trypsin-like peptidase domain-containing protein [Rhodopila sp.]
MTLLGLAAPVCVIRQPAAAADIGPPKGDLIQSLLPTVVNITTSKVEPLNSPPTDPAQAAAPQTPPKAAPANPNAPTTVKDYVGSGFVIDPSGVIVTNYHVVEDSFKTVVTLSDGTRHLGRTLSASRLADIALVKIDVDHPLQAAHWGDSDMVQVGDQVFAAGNPFGIGLSVSAGIVSGLNRDIQNSPYDDLIQTDATINHGNSGGPLFNMKGQVVGVNSAIISPTTGSAGLGFAIPARSAEFVIKRLMTYGWVRPAWIGLKLQDVTPEIAQSLGMEQARGSIVSWVSPDGPSGKAGLRVGDVIMTFDGRTPSDERALLRDIAESDVGKTITLGVERNGRPQELHVVTGEWPRNQWEALDAPVKTRQPMIHIPPDLGLTLAPLPADERARLGLSTYKEGVLIAALPPNSDPARRGLKTGDVVLRVQDKPVFTKADVLSAIAAERAAKRRYVLFLIWPKVRKVPGPKWFALEAGPDGF